MSNTAEPRGLTKGQRNFSYYLLSGLLTLILVASFGQQDRRAILLWMQPEAFAIGELEEGFAGNPRYPVVWSQPTSGTAARTIDRRPRTGYVAPSAGQPASPAAGVGRPAAPGTQFTPTAPSEVRTTPSGGGNNGGPGGSYGGSFGPGFGPGGVIITPTSSPPIDRPDSPVVPAVPEPASWLLMIIGVGALGHALRRKRSTGLTPVAA